MKEFGKFCLRFILTIISTLVGGYVFLQLYNWFILVPFHTPSINLAQAIGLKLIISFTHTFPKPSEIETTPKSIAHDAFLYNFVVLSMWGIGYLITLFV